MKKTNYEQGQIPTPADMNDQHILTEDALGALVEAMTGGLTSALLTNRPPTITESGANWKLDIPEQFAAVQGRYFKIEASSVSLPILDKNYGVYFILKEVDVNETRERLRLSGSTPVRENFTPTTRKEEVSRIAYTESVNLSEDAPTPSLSPDDVGYILFATVESVTGTPPASTVTLNTGAVWNFPGGGLAVGLHALTHMPGGNDQIPLATLGGPQGSSAGLMPETALAFAYEGIQDVVVASTSPYLLATDSGQSTLQSPKKVTLEMKLHNSLEVKDTSGVKQLGIRFATGPYAGNSGVAPHSNHTHSLAESPVTADSVLVDITSAAQLGSIITIPPFGAMSDIYSIQVLWGPPTLNTPVPGIECNWSKTTTGFVGVRAHKSAANEVTLEIGREGLTQFQDSVRDWIIDRYTGSQTWDSATSDGTTPRNGKLYVRVIGIR